MRVFVLLFNAGTDNEGIHTIRMGDRNLVLMFEDEDDATRYALLLEAQDFPAPNVESIPRAEIEDFCNSVGYDSKLVPAGFVPQSDEERLLLAPPVANLEETDWDKREKLDSAFADPLSELDDDDDSMSQRDLEAMRRKLEGLL
jgi:Protein of unknown function (DUF3110)